MSISKLLREGWFAKLLKGRGKWQGTKLATAALVTTVGLGTGAMAASFSYSYANPYDANAQTYIHSTSNISLYTEGTVRLWKPNVGGPTLATTTPGVLTYKFDFGTEIVESAKLLTNNPTFHWSYSRGYNKFFGSKDGVVWEELLEVTTPAFATANSGVFNNFLPSSLLGGTQLWFKAELYSFGPSANRGGILTNTAQHSRWDVGQGSSAKTFALDVDFKAPPAVPLPAGLPLMGSGLLIFGLLRRRARKA